MTLRLPRSIAFTAAAVIAWAALAQPASAPAGKPPMREMSPKTGTQGPVPMPPRADDVWVNTSSRVYHCRGTRWYGRTPTGVWLSEADARSQGYRPESPKGCAS